VPQQQHYYKPDWITPSGILVESKGLLTVQDKQKLKLIREQHPDKLIALLFQRNLKLTKAKNSKRYVDWAIENKFPVAVGEVVPDDWMNRNKFAVLTLHKQNPRRWLKDDGRRTRTSTASTT
jgi:hypothetical protein